MSSDDIYEMIVRSRYSPTDKKNTPLPERGGIIPLVAVFVVSFVSLLAYSVDGYFLFQSRTDIQNIAEYYCLAGLSEFKNPSFASNMTYQYRQDQARLAMDDLANNNEVLGTSYSNTGSGCDDNFCWAGSSFTVFGSWDGNSFTPLPTTDHTAVNAIQISTWVSYDQNFITYFYQKASGSSGLIQTSAVCHYYEESGNQRFKLIKKIGSGYAM